MQRVNPPVNTVGRAMFLWDKVDVDTSAERASLVSFCVANGITKVLLHFYEWIGNTNWTTTTQANLVALISSLHGAAIRVGALIGAEDYAQNQRWVKKAIIDAVSAFQASSPGQKFDELVFDCEYWTDPLTYDPLVYIPAYRDLISFTRNHLQLPVGVFAQRNLLDEGGTVISCRGLTDVAGAHLLAEADAIYVGSYDDRAMPHDGYPGQVEMIRPWVQRADLDGKGKLVWGCSETTDVQPAWITYRGATKSAMEVEHEIIAAQLSSDTGTSYCGQAIHDYRGYKAML